MKPGEPLLVVSDLHAGYGQMEILHGVNLSVAAGRSVCMIGPNERAVPLITFDPWSRLWMYVLMNGSYGILRSSGWEGDRIAFIGTMTMLGVTCEWRMAWTKAGPDEFAFVNEERSVDGRWNYVDEWRYRRKRTI